MSNKPIFSRLRGGLRVGADFFARRGLVREAPRVSGVVDGMADLANPSLDIASIHPDVRVFFEDTTSLDLFIRSEWRFPFSILWAIFRPLFRLVGQFALPRHEATIHTKVFPIDVAADGRADVRGVVRTYADTNATMQAVAYATWQAGETRFMSAAFPLPFCQLTGILRLDAEGDGVTLTSARRDRDAAGVYWVFGPFALRTPLAERLSLWPAKHQNERPEATIVGRHQQFLFGVRVVTHHYWFLPRRAARHS